MQINPLLQRTKLPKFSQIKPSHFKPAIRALITENRSRIKKLVAQQHFTWDNFMVPFMELNERLTSVWALIHHLNAVMATPQIRRAYDSCLPLVTDYSIKIMQATPIYQAIAAIANDASYTKLNGTQKKIIAKQLADFHLAGIDLAATKKQQLHHLSHQLAQLESKFAHNLLNATQNWTIQLNAKEIKGIPESTCALARAAALSNKRAGWLFSLDFPSYQAIMNFAESRTVRKKVHYAFATRASEIGPTAKRWDNSKIIARILKTRHKIAHLTGYLNYATYSLATKMASSPAQVLDFLHELANRTLPLAQQEAAELKEFAKTIGINRLSSWDIAYCTEKLKQKKFKLAQEELRPYFPVEQVLAGLFAIVHRLYGITITAKEKVEVWHPQVRFFTIYDHKHNLRGQFYLDLYYRTNKRGGAWLGTYKTRYRKNGKVKTPVAFIVCNFSPPLGEQPALLTHQEVITLFHEFGHCLHHLLSQVDYSAASGINAIPWDVVEFPSQFMENWCWQPQALKLLTRNYKNQKPIPNSLLRPLLASHNFQAAINMLRQLKLALFDFRIHLELNPNQRHQLTKIIKQIEQAIRVLPIAPYTRLPHSFSHIFAGGYAAGYYSYKWAEVLAADAFARFKKQGIFDKKSGTAFRRYIFERGSSADPLTLFKKFRGRAPQIAPLLRQSGIK